MRKVATLLLIMCLGLLNLHAQDCPSVDPTICWPNTNTGNNHTLLIDGAAVLTLNGTPIPLNSYIGVFYDDGGVLENGGYVLWTGVTTAFPAYGEDVGGDGFATNEAFQFKFLLPDGDIIDGVAATFAPITPPLITDEGNYQVDGFSQVLSLSATTCSDYSNTTTIYTCNAGDVGVVIDSFEVNGCDSVEIEETILGHLNDDCANATPLIVGGQCVLDTFSNACATSENPTVSNPTCGAYQGSDVWFTVVVPLSGALRIEIDPLDFNNGSVEVYSGTCGGLTSVLCSAFDLTKTLSDPSLAGQTLYIRTWAFNSSTGGTFSICVYEPPIPMNDNCEDALFVPTEATCTPFSFSNAFSTEEDVIPNPGCGAYQGADVWFKTVVPASGEFRVEIDEDISGFNISYSLYSGDCSGFTQILCDGLDPANTLYIPNLAGDTIYIQFFTYNSDEGNVFDLCFWEPPIPANDNCVNSITLPVNNECINQSFDVTYSTFEDGIAPGPGCGALRNADVWFDFVMPASGELRIEVTENVSGFNASYALYTGTCGDFQLIFCDGLDDDNTFVDTTLAGQTIYLRVWPYNAEDGAIFDVCLWDPPVPPNDNCENAIPLDIYPRCLTQTFVNSYATEQPSGVAAINPNCGAYRGGDVWFTAVMPYTGELIIEVQDLPGAGNPEIAVYTGTCGNFTLVECASLSNNDIEIINPALIGETLYIRNWTYNSEEGQDFGICAIGCIVFTDSIFVETCDPGSIGTDVDSLLSVDNCDSLIYTITTGETEPPVAICQDVTVQLNAAGSVLVLASEVNNGSTDNCAIGAVSLSQSQFTCNNVGNNSVELYITDGFSNSDTCSATITVQDNVAPVAMCQDITLQLDVTGSASTSAAAVDNGSSDACGIASLSLNPVEFICEEAGPNPVTLTVEDNNGNVSTCQATVTVEDNILPTAICQDITIQLDETGSATANVSAVNNGSNDGCGIASLELIPSTFVCEEVGPNPVTLTVQDNNGNISSCQATVTVEDNIAPVAGCQDITVYLDGTGNALASAFDVTNGSSDNCAIASIELSQESFTCSDPGVNDVELYVTDDAGNIDTCTATITVLDTTPPVAICQDITISLNASGLVTFSNNDVNNGSTDNCSVSFSQQAFVRDCNDLGSNNFTLSVADPSGNVDECIAVVTVEDPSDVCVVDPCDNDIVPPIAVCQDATVQLDASGAATVTAGDINNGSLDNCGILSLSVNPSTFTCAHLGANTVQLTVTDNSSNSSACLSNVSVVDNLSPTAVCQDITIALNATGLVGHLAEDIDGGSSDNCGFTYVGGSGTYSCIRVGQNAVTLVIEDAAGNRDQCIATVTVIDELAPLANCQDVTVNLDANGEATLTAGMLDIGSSDNCSVSLALERSLLGCPDAGIVEVDLYVFDPAQNADTCTSTITVFDVNPPTAICQDLTVYLDAGGTASILPADIDNGSTDECGVGLSVSPSSFDCSDIGTNTVSLGATDAFNISFCTATVTVLDTLPPVLFCASTLTVPAEPESCNAFVDVPQPEFDDNCLTDNSMAAILGVSTPGDFITDENILGAFDQISIDLPTGSTVVDVNVEVDVSHTFVSDIDLGIISPALTTVLLLSRPVNCSDDNLLIEFDDEASTTASALENWCMGTDPWYSGRARPLNALSNFDGQLASGLWTFYVQDFAEFDNGTINLWSIIIEYNDPNGRAMVQRYTSDLKSERTTAIDLIPFASSSVRHKLTGADPVNERLAPGDPLYTLTNDITGTDDASAVYPVGSTIVTWTITDAAGLTATCSQEVVVEDEEAPTAICQDITIALNPNGQVTISAGDIDGGSFDNCSVTGLAVSSNTFNCQDINGSNSVVLTVSDAAGNIGSCTASIALTDPLGSCGAPPTTDTIMVCIAPNTSEVVCVDDVLQLGALVNADICGNTGAQFTPDGITCLDISAPADPSVIDTICVYHCDANRCDTTIIIVKGSYEVTVQETTCFPADTGTVLQDLEAANGCDSIVTTITTLLPSDAVTLFDSSCFPQDTGTFVQDLENGAGCDSIVTTIVSLLPSDAVTIFDSSCFPQDTGTFVQDLENGAGCDSIVTTIVSLLPSDEVTILEASCFPQDTGRVVFDLENGFGCDSTVTVITELAPSYFEIVSDVSCDPNEVGTYFDSLETTLGCDSVFLYIISSATPVYDTLYAFSCDENEVGSEDETFEAANGCDSIVTTITELLPSYDITFLDITCVSQEAGIFIDSLETSAGCDSIITTIVELQDDYYVLVEVGTCNPEDTGTVVLLLESEEGCDSTVTISTHLGIPGLAELDIVDCPGDGQGPFDYCLGLPLGEVLNYDLYIDGELYVDFPFICEIDTFGGYDFTTVIDNGTYGGSTFILRSWTVNGVNIVPSDFTYSTFEELVAYMNFLNPIGHWEFDTDFIKGGEPPTTSVYGLIEVFSPDLGTLSFTNYNIGYLGESTLLTGLNPGCQWITFDPGDNQELCADSILVCFNCNDDITPDTMYITMPVNSFEPDLCPTADDIEMVIGIDYELCNGGSLYTGSALLGPPDACPTYISGPVPGDFVDTICVIGTDFLGNMDTTVYIITIFQECQDVYVTVDDASCFPQDTGRVVETIPLANGCDSIVTTITTLLPSDAVTVFTTTCDPQQPLEVIEELENSFGCDSIVTTIYELLESYDVLIERESCFPQDTGTVVQDLDATNGCDSIVTTITTLLPSNAVTVFATTCDPQQPLEEIEELENSFGCDSIVTTIYELLDGYTDTVYAETCDPDQAGTTVQTFEAQNGCDSTITYITELLDSYEFYMEKEVCDPIWAGPMTTTYTAQNGCDSVVTIFGIYVPIEADFDVDIDHRTVQFTSLGQDDIDFHFWWFGDFHWSFDANPEHTYWLPGVYLVKHLVWKQDCNIDLEIKLIFIFGRHHWVFEAREEQEPTTFLESLKAYPNPSFGGVTLDIELSKMTYEKGMLQIIDIYGRTWRQQKIDLIDQQLDLHDLPQGTYSIRIILNNEAIEQRVIIIK